jgi:methoxymalonate biosynthesis acyl carrier protein
VTGGQSHDPRARIREFVEEHVGAPLADGDDIFASGYVNSLFAVQIVMWLERELGVPMQSEDLDIDNVRSIDSLTALVERKTGAVAPT